MEVSELRAIVAKNVRVLAEARGLSLNALADFAVVSRSQLHLLLGAERGGSLSLIAQIAKALSVEPWQLLHPNAPNLGAKSHRTKRRRT